MSNDSDDAEGPTRPDTKVVLIGVVLMLTTWLGVEIMMRDVLGEEFATVSVLGAEFRVSVLATVLVAILYMRYEERITSWWRNE